LYDFIPNKAARTRRLDGVISSGWCREKWNVWERERDNLFTIYILRTYYYNNISWKVAGIGVRPSTLAIYMGLLSKRSVSVGLAFHVAIRLTINFIDLMANRLQRVQAPVVVMITCSYRFNRKSLLVKPVNTHFHYSDYPPWRLYQIAIKFYEIISQRLAITSNWRHISTNIKCGNSSWICVPDWKK